MTKGSDDTYERHKRLGSPHLCSIGCVSASATEHEESDIHLYTLLQQQQLLRLRHCRHYVYCYPHYYWNC